MRLQKTYEVASFKALPDEDGQTGRFEALVSVFGNVDLQGDVVMPGAFEKSLAKWQEAGDPIPVIWSHDWADPFAHIGFVDPKNAVEIMPGTKAGTEGRGGLKVVGQIDLDKPFARQVYDLMKTRRVKEFSFAYDVVAENFNEQTSANELHILDIIEVGPTLKGANPDTVSLSVKSRQELDSVKADLAKAKADEELLMQAAEIDPEITEALMTSERKKAAQPDRFRVEQRIAFTGEKYDLEQPPKFVCMNVTKKQECGHFHKSEEEAEQHIKGLKNPDVETEVATDLQVEVHRAGDDNWTPDLADDRGEDDSFVPVAADDLLAEDEKGSKPWHVEKRGDKWCVVKDSDGETVACHDTEEEANAQMRALYANEASATPDTAKGIDEAAQAVEEYAMTTEEAEKAMHNLIDAVMYGEKAGRVIGAKRVTQLTTTLADAVKEWAAQVNGDLADEEIAAEKERKAAPSEFNARLDEILAR